MKLTVKYWESGAESVILKTKCNNNHKARPIKTVEYWESGTEFAIVETKFNNNHKVTVKYWESGTEFAILKTRCNNNHKVAITHLLLLQSARHPIFAVTKKMCVSFKMISSS